MVRALTAAWTVCLWLAASAVAVAAPPWVGNDTVTPTGGNTTRVLDDVVNDAGFSVLSMGAICDGTTDDTAAINAALNNGSRKVTIPAGQTCYSATGITVPSLVSLEGVGFQPTTDASNAIDTSQIMCAANIAACVTMGSGSSYERGVSLRNLVISTNATGTPTGGACVYALNVHRGTIENVMANNCFNGFSLKGGLGYYLNQDYTWGAMPGSQILQDTVPELYIRGGRYGGTGSTSFITVQGGVPGSGGSSGPNGLSIVGVQFNTTPGPSYFVNVIGNTGDVGAAATDFRLSNILVEPGTGFLAFFHSDSSWQVINRFSMTNAYFNSGAAQCFQLDPGTQLVQAEIGDSYMNCLFTMAPTSREDIGLTNVVIDKALSLTSGSANSSAFLNNVRVTGNMTFAGSNWAPLTVYGASLTGTLSNTATGSVDLAIAGATGRHIFSNSAGTDVAVDAPVGQVRSFYLNSGGLHRWSLADTAGDNFALGSYDGTGASQWNPLTISNSTGVVSLNKGATLGALTVATLPTCNAGASGQMLRVTDATAPAYNATLAGGGGVNVMAFCNGTNWTAH